MGQRLFGLIGYPLSHSFSETYFTEKFKRESISDARYQLFPIERIELLPELLKEQPQLKGLNVTIPFKEAVLPFLHQLDPVAEKVKAVNCIRIDEGRLTGFNTDVFGFKQSIKPFLESHHERALIFGTGGASKAVVHVLEEIGIDCYFVTRDKQTLQGKKGFDYEELNEYVLNAFKLLVNTTPVGMYPTISEFLPLPYEFIGPSHLVYDLIYNPEQTELLKKAKQQGATTLNGLSMLKQQAEEAWRIWNL